MPRTIMVVVHFEGKPYHVNCNMSHPKFNLFKAQGTWFTARPAGDTGKPEWRSWKG
jgi:hypothetical protein